MASRRVKSVRAVFMGPFVPLFTDTMLLEKASIDEAFIDFTHPVREELLKRYPHLATVPSDAPNGKDTPLPPPPHVSWDKLGTRVPIYPSLPLSPTEFQHTNEETMDESNNDGHEEPIAPKRDVAEASVNMEPGRPMDKDDDNITWHDIALSIAAELMGKIRYDIHTKLGYTTSAVRPHVKTAAWKLNAKFRAR
jgi:DNA polymerase eta